MSGRSALFCADASPDIGGGHIVRCGALANEFVKHDVECHLLTKEISLELFPKFNSAFSKIAFYNMQDHLDTKYDFLILDLPEVNQSKITEFISLSETMLVFSDNPKDKLYADFLLDSNFGRLAKDYEGLINKNCKLLLGSQYVPIREALFDRSKFDQSNLDRDHILISVGFTDPANMIERYLKALIENENIYPVDIVIGFAPEVLNTIEILRETLLFPLNVHIQPDNLNAIYKRAKFALGAGGVSVWERAALMIPSITVQVAENQRHLLEAMHENGALMHLGEATKLCDETLNDAIKFALSNNDRLLSMSQRAQRFCDGKGVVRITKEVLGLKD